MAPCLKRLSRVVEEKRFSVNGYQLAAKEWHCGAPRKVLALHGWLDNAASFDALAPILEDCHVVALDMPGHGQSDHKSPQASYNLWDDLLDVLAVADQLEWDQFILLGHSRGALMSTLLAGAMPERLSHVILLDAVWPQAVEPAQGPKQLGKFLRDNRSVHKKRLPSYDSIDDAVAARCRGFLPMSEASARLIVERGIKEQEGVFRWTNDPRLSNASAFKMTNEHNQAFMAAISMPALLLMAEQGLAGHSQQREQLKQYSHIEQKVLAGGHHFHMDEAAVDIAAAIKVFISERSIA